MTPPRIVAAASFVALLALPKVLTAQAIPDSAHGLNVRLTAKLRPSLQTWVASEVKKVEADAQMTDAAVNRDAASSFSNNGLTSADVDALVFIVMMRVALDADQELRSTLDNLKATTREKAKNREVKQRVDADLAADALARNVLVRDPSAQPVSRLNIGAANIARAGLQASRDSLTDMGSETNLRLQMLMDRRSTLISSLSNLMKKVSETESTITQNLK